MYDGGAGALIRALVVELVHPRVAVGGAWSKDQSTTVSRGAASPPVPGLKTGNGGACTDAQRTRAAHADLSSDRKTSTALAHCRFTRARKLWGNRHTTTQWRGGRPRTWPGKGTEPSPANHAVRGTTTPHSRPAPTQGQQQRHTRHTRITAVIRMRCRCECQHT